MMAIDSVLVGAAPAAPVEDGALAVVADPAVDELPVAVFDEELHAAAPATKKAAPTALSTVLDLNLLIVNPPIDAP
jgi:hypothetical protein